MIRGEFEVDTYDKDYDGDFCRERGDTIYLERGYVKVGSQWFEAEQLMAVLQAAQALAKLK